MFYVLSIKDGSVFKRRRLYKNPVVKEKRVQGGLPFNVIETSIYKKKLNFSKIGDICGKLKQRVLFPTDIERPYDFKEIDCDNFNKLLLFNATLELIKRIGENDKRISMCIIDRTAAAASRISKLVPIISDLSVKTDRDDLYNIEIERAMDEYGAKIRLTKNPQADIILNLDNEDVIAKAVIGLAENENNRQINLPYCYSSICPPKINKVQFANCLYNFSKAAGLGEISFSYVNINKNDLDFKEGLSTLKRLCY